MSEVWLNISENRKQIIITCLCMMAIALGYGLIKLYVSLACPVSLSEAVVKMIDEPQQPSIECEIPIPNNTDRILFIRRQTQIFRAEYERQICFINGSGSKTFKRFPRNEGGKTFINVFWFAGTETQRPYLKLEDHTGNYIVDLRGQKLYLPRKYENIPHLDCIDLASDGQVATGCTIVNDKTGCTGMVEILPGQILGGVRVGSNSTYIGTLDAWNGPLEFVPGKKAPESRTARALARDPS